MTGRVPSTCKCGQEAGMVLGSGVWTGNILHATQGCHVSAPARTTSSTEPADPLHSPRQDGPECNTGTADA